MLNSPGRPVAPIPGGLIPPGQLRSGFPKNFKLRNPPPSTTVQPIWHPLLELIHPSWMMHSRAADFPLYRGVCVHSCLEHEPPSFSPLGGGRPLISSVYPILEAMLVWCETCPSSTYQCLHLLECHVKIFIWSLWCPVWSMFQWILDTWMSACKRDWKTMWVLCKYPLKSVLCWGSSYCSPCARDG